MVWPLRNPIIFNPTCSGLFREAREVGGGQFGPLIIFGVLMPRVPFLFDIIKITLKISLLTKIQVSSTIFGKLRANRKFQILVKSGILGNQVLENI